MERHLYEGKSAQRAYEVTRSESRQGYESHLFTAKDGVFKNEVSRIEESKIIEIRNEHVYDEATRSVQKHGWLPGLFWGIIQKAKEILMGLIWEEDAYSRKKRRESELIFCKVIFQDAEKEYTYLADEDIYEKGDFAWALAGKDNEEKIVRVTDVEYLQPEEAPFPVEKTKKLIRKLTPENMRGMSRRGEDD